MQDITFSQATALFTSWSAMTDSHAFPLCQHWTCSNRCLWIFHCDSNGKFFNELGCELHVNTYTLALFPLWNDVISSFLSILNRTYSFLLLTLRYSLHILEANQFPNISFIPHPSVRVLFHNSLKSICMYHTFVVCLFAQQERRAREIGKVQVSVDV